MPKAGADRNQKERKDAEERSSPSGAVLYRAILKEGRDELERPTSALFWSGIAAGISMGGSLIAEGLLSSMLPDARWRPLIAKFGYSLGFLMVILGRQQLFTENTLTPILPLLQEKTVSRLLGVMRLWSTVLIANIFGCLAIAVASNWELVFATEVRSAFAEIGRQAMQGSFTAHLARGIFAGWLIALMVWLLPFAESARIWVIILLSYVIGIGHFSHVIAGSVQVFFLAASGMESWLTVVSRYIVPTLLGNILGGITLVAALNHAQVVSGGKGEDL